MHRFLIFSAAVVLTLSALSRAQNAPEIGGTWTAELRTGKVFLQLRVSSPTGGDSSYGESIPVDEFGGIPAREPNFTVASIKFDLRREAGVFAFEGAFRDGRGAGLFVFTPRAAYVAEMKALGYADDLTPWRQYQLATRDVGPTFVKALGAEGYEKLPLETIMRAKTHGVTVEYLRALKALGYGAVPMEGLIRVRDHGVTPELIRELRAAAVAVSTLDDYVRLVDHGVRPQYLAELKKAGYDKLAADELVRMRDHGVSAEYIDDLKGVGLKDLTVAQLVRLHDHGITPGFVNHVRARGYKDAGAEELVRLKNRGLY